MHTILVPVDGSVHALKALRIACDLADKYGGRIVLLHVLAEGRDVDDLLGLASASIFGPALTDELQAHAGKSVDPVSFNLLEAVGLKVLKQAATKVRRRSIKVDVLEIQFGDPAECILINLKRTRASTIVMGSRGASKGDKLSFGSVSNVVFERAKCTCLSVK